LTEIVPQGLFVITSLVYRFSCLLTLSGFRCHRHETMLTVFRGLLVSSRLQQPKSPDDARKNTSSRLFGSLLRATKYPDVRLREKEQDISVAQSRNYLLVVNSLYRFIVRVLLGLC
jgi:hypothetical protein